ncbi:MAG: hypothetical protein CMM07_12610 [Rhodopirellula sp.]|nr:hypothetical protein [Rhodopirellula sp.]
MLASLELHILAAELVYAAKRRCSQTIDVTRGLAYLAATAKVNFSLAHSRVAIEPSRVIRQLVSKSYQLAAVSDLPVTRKILVK